MAMLTIDTFGCLFFLLQARKLPCPNANDYGSRWVLRKRVKMKGGNGYG